MPGPLWTARPESGNASGRRVRPGALPVLVAALVIYVLTALLSASSARADDRVATAWQEQAGTAPLLQAPRPANPVTICVIDTGVNSTADLEVTARRSLLGGTLDDVQAAPGQTGHGTPVAHFAGGKVNGWGGAGAFPHARVSSVRIFPAGGRARWQDYTNALDHCYWSDRRTKVVVMSLGGQTIQSGESAELEDRIKTMRLSAGFNVVVAAGNGGGETDFPGRYPASFTVAALDGGGALCGFSARGTGVDIAAPGCGLEQGAWDGSLWSMNGTSFAAPIVAGTLAAIRSYRPDLGPDEAEQVLLSSARPATAAGRFPSLDASAALRAIGQGAIVDNYRAHAPPGAAPATAAPSAPVGSWTVPAGTEPRGARSSSARASRLRAPKLRLGRVAGGRVLVRAINRPRGALLELRVGSRKTMREGAKVRLKVGGARQVKARYVTELSASRWVRVTIRRR